MRRLVPPLTLFALLGLALLPSIALADEGASIRGVENGDFPLIRLTVSTDEQASLDVSQVRILENGVPVRVVDVEALDEGGHDVDAVLAIDVSNSMAGPQLQTALAAARAFVQGVPSSLPVGIVSFAADPVIQSPITDDRAAVELAVASITATTSQGTALFDTIVQASGMFDGSGQHNLILLTDGRCRANPSGHGPCTLEGTLDGAVEAANAAGVTVFTFGLSETQTAVPVLAAIAERTGGEHAIISLDELQGVYAGLASELSHQFVITYRSKAPYGVPVEVEVSLPNGSATTKFLTPGLSALTGEEPASAGREGARTSAVTSDAAIAVIAGLAFLATLNLILFLESLRQQRRREMQLRSRLIGETVTGAIPEIPDTPSNAWIPSAIAKMAERAAGSSRAAGALSRRLHQADWTLKVGELLALVMLAGLAGAVGGFLLLGPVGVLLAVPAAVSPLVVLATAAAKRLAAFQAQLADTLMVMASSLRAGHSFLQSLDTVTKEIGEPGSTEFGRTMSEVRLGREVDDALDALVERIGSRDLEWVGTAIKIQRKIGGNLAEVLEGVAATIRERETLRRQVKVLSAEGRISAVVLTVLPILVAVYLTFVNPEYLGLLTSTRTGIILLSSAGGLMVVGYLWMQKIVRLDDV